MQVDYSQPGEKTDWAELPTQYPRNMKAQEKYAWYKPVLVAIVAAILWVVFSVIIYIPMMFWSIADAGSVDAASLVTTDPLSTPEFSLSLLCLALFIPALGIAMKIFGLGGLRTLSSVEGKLRWDRILAFAAPAVIVAVVFIALSTVGCFATGAYNASELRFVPAAIVAVIILAPLQSAGEEYLFRGFVFQTFSSWIPVLVIPLLAQALIFGSLHSQYNIVGMFECAFTGLCCAYLACKTGGLESAICVHASNNTIAMLQFCFIASSAPTYDVDAVSLVLDIAMIACMTIAIMVVAKKKGYILKKQ